MGAMTIRSEVSRELTHDDLRAMPDDGHRHEIVDGSLIVTPAPATRHQLVAMALYRQLFAACPPGMVVLVAPFDVKISEVTVLKPDLLVAEEDALGEDNLPAAPLLAVEVLSPSTRRIDLGLKRRRYEEAGTPSYWVVDPAATSIIAWELVDGAYVEAGRATGVETLALLRPFTLSVVLSDLLDVRWLTLGRRSADDGQTPGWVPPLAGRR